MASMFSRVVVSLFRTWGLRIFRPLKCSWCARSSGKVREAMGLAFWRISNTCTSVGKMLIDDRKHVSNHRFRRPYALGGM